MGHDIYACRPGIDRNNLYREAVSGYEITDDFYDRFEAWQTAVYVASLRRSAGNPLNQVIYLALGVMDEAYAGCSGNGSELKITLDQFRAGLEVIDTKSFADMQRDRNLSDDVFDMLRGAGITAVEMGIARDEDVSPEREFLQRCILFCEQNNIDQLTVSFQ